MRTVTVQLRADNVIGTTDRRLFGAFIEHLGRCVYGGIFEPGHPTADAQRLPPATCWRWCASWRPPSCAIPAAISSPATTGRTASARWSSGRAGSTSPGCRPRPNTFGTNEFIDWCRAAGIEPMLAVNLGTRGADAARSLRRILQPSRRHRAVRPPPRARLGAAARRQVLVPRQRDGRALADGARRPPSEYGRIATEAAKMMKWVDRIDRARGLRLVGPQHADLRRLGRHACWSTRFDHVEYISLHTYLNNYADDTPAFLASPDLMDSFIDEVVAIADAVAARRRSRKRIMLSFDEWNVWYRTRRNREERVKPGWPVAPPHPGGGLHDGGRAGVRRRLHLAAQPRRPGEVARASRSSST